MAMVPVQIEFETGPLAGLWLQPPETDAAMLLAHGAGAGMQHPNLELLASELASRNIATLRFQFPFMQRRLAKQAKGRSSGQSHRSFGPTDKPEVAVCAIGRAWNRLKGLAPATPLFAAGHSYGARMVSIAVSLERLPDCRAIVMASYPLHPPGKPSLNRTEHWSAIRRPVLFLSGTHDRMATPEWFEAAVQRLTAPYRLVWLDAVDHGYAVKKRLRTETRTVFQEMADSIRNWIDGQINR